MQLRFALAASFAFLCCLEGASHAQPAKPDVPRVETYYGLWRDGDGKPLFFEPTGVNNPTETKFVRAKTLVKGRKDAREWGGHYDEGKLNLHYRPTAEEMNAKLPLWVRKAAFEQILRWRMEISAIPACGAEDTIIVKWFPGEIDWEDGAGEKPESVKVVGEGKPIEIKYKRDLEIETEFTSAPSIGLYAKDGGWIDSPDVKYVMRDESFRLEVLLPRAQAEKQGEKLSVRFTSKLSGKSLDMELARAPIERLSAARYTTKDAITVESLDKILGAKKGDFRGEDVTASFGDAARAMRVFASPVARALYRIHHALEDHEAIWLTHIQSPTLSKEDKEYAQQRLRLVRNAKALADSDTFYDYRHAMVEQYLSDDGMSGLILRKELTWIHGAEVGTTAKIDLHSGKVWDLGFGWAAEEEKIHVKGAYTFAARDKVKEVTKATMFAVYDIIATSTRGDKIVMVLFGIDHFGRRVEAVDRVGAIGRFFVPDPSNPLDWFAFTRMSGRFVSASKRLGKATKGLDAARATASGDLPPGAMARIRKAFEAADAKKADDPGQCLGTLGSSKPVPGRAHENYPESFKLLPDGAMPQHGQVTDRGCLLGSFAHEFKERRGVELNQHGLRKYLEEGRRERGEGVAGLGVKRGIAWDEAAPIAHATGAKHAPHHLTRYEIVHYHEKTNWSVFLSMAPKKGIRHAVVLKALERDAATGKIKRVVFFDPDVIDPRTGKKGHIVYTDKPCDFWDSVATDDNAMLINWESFAK